MTLGSAFTLALGASTSSTIKAISGSGSLTMVKNINTSEVMYNITHHLPE